jgi:hypothetical protein
MELPRQCGYKAVESLHCYSELHATTLNQVGVDYNTMKLQYVRPHHASGGGGREVAGPIEESIG